MKKKIENYILNMDEVLGEGSFGKVYRGINENDKSQVAVKVLSKKQINQDQSFKEAYVTEIKIMKKLHSDNIVQFIDVVQTQHNYYIVQEYCNGGDLRTKLNKEKCFSEKVATEYLLQLLNGFIELLAHGIIHRDMKPQNILIHNKKAKIADFGFAKNVLWRSELNKTLVGTPLYMSLQMLKEEKYTSKCDIWAIGLLFYQMIYGRVPWLGKSEYELVEVIIKTPLKFPKQPQISENARNFIQGCLKLQQAERFGWNEVYNHPLVGGSFKEFIVNHDRMERKAKEVINQMRIEVHSQNIDVETIFKGVKESALHKKQFLELVKNLYKTISEEEFKNLFEKLDTARTGLIQIEQFKKYLGENGVRFKSNKVRKEVAAKQNPKEGEDKVSSIINKIKTKIEVHKLNLDTVFSSYTKNKQSDLSYEMFTKLVSKIDATATEADVKKCFEAFDHNKDGKITFAQFSKTLGKK